MSNIATNSIVGKIFNPIVTNLTYEELDTMRAEETSINIPNCILFSIPQTNYVSGDNEDIQGEGSIWLTDTNGYLYCMTKPINQYLKFESLLDIITPTTNINGDRKIVSIKWNPGGDTVENSSEQGYNPVSSFNALIVTYDNNVSEKINVNTINNFKLNITTDPAGKNSANSFWYNSPGVYYIKGIILSYRTVNNKDLETENVLKWTIYKSSSEIPNNPTPVTPNNPDTPDTPTPVIPSVNKYYWYVGATLPTSLPASASDVQTDNTKPGWHEIGTSLSGFIHDMNEVPNRITIVEHPTSWDDFIHYYVVIPAEVNFKDAVGSNLKTNGEYTKERNFSISDYEAYKSNDTAVVVQGLIFEG